MKVLFTTSSSYWTLDLEGNTISRQPINPEDRDHPTFKYDLLSEETALDHCEVVKLFGGDLHLNGVLADGMPFLSGFLTEFPTII